MENNNTELLELDKTINNSDNINLSDDIYKNLMFVHSMALKTLNTKFEIAQEEFKVLYNYNLIDNITSRIKKPESIINKMKKKNIDLTYRNLLDNVNDIAGIRLICNTKDDIFLIRDLVSNMVGVRIVKEKDYVTYPKKSGYSSYHMLVEIPVNVGRDVVNVKSEIQIRTKIMDLWASIEHDIKYKTSNQISKKISDELISCAKKLDKIDNQMNKLYLKALDRNQKYVNKHIKKISIK